MDKQLFYKFIKNKELDYRKLFNGDDEKKTIAAQSVIADLRTFCHATKSTFSTDALTMAKLEGRREVFNRIMSFLKVDIEEVYNYDEDFDL